MLPKSRYATEFEEVAFVGKGGFGSVVKCRLRRRLEDEDDIFFAVKKIKLPVSSTQADDDKFVLREASNLASLHHRNIVRYFSAWLEEVVKDPSAVSLERSVYSRHRRLPKLLPVATVPLYFSTRSLVQKGDWLSIHQTSSVARSSQHRDPPSSIKAFLREQLISNANPEPLSSSSSSPGGPRNVSDSSDEVVFEENPIVDAAWGPTPTRRVRKTVERRVDRCLHIAMEFVEGLTLRQAISNASFVKNKRLAWEVFRQICEGLAFMHQHSFVHRDLKPENIFIKVDDEECPWTVKIGDFGLSTFIDNRDDSLSVLDDHHAPLSVGVGTRFYIAPEVLRAEGQYDQAADMFGVGVILYEMFTPPVKTSMERYVTLTHLIESQGQAAEQLGVSDKLAPTLISQLLVRDPEQRISAIKLLQLLPQKTSGDQILDIVTANPFSHEMLRLLTSLFGRHETHDRAKRFWENYSLPSVFVSRVVTELKAYIHCLFRTFNAVQIDLPILTPSTSQIDERRTVQPFRILDASGMPLALSLNLLRRMKDTLGSVQLATVVKRFAVEDVYFQGANKDFWDCPNSALRIVFDVAVNLTKLEGLDRTADRYQRLAIFESDPMRVLWVIGQGFQPWIGEGVIIYTFGALLPLLLTVVLKIPWDKSRDLAATIRSTKFSRVTLLNKFKEVLSAELKSGQFNVKDFEPYLKMVESWRPSDKSGVIIQRILDLIVLEESSDPTVQRLLNLINHINVLQETLTACLGTSVANNYIELSICLGYEQTFFDAGGDDDFMFLYHIRRPTAAAASVLKFSAGFDGLTDQTDNILGLGGTYLSHRRFAGDSRTGFGVEIDIQLVIDSILISTSDSESTGTEVSRWKSRWRNHLSRSKEVISDEESPSKHDTRRQFLLLPPSTPLDTVKWLRTLQTMVGEESALDAEVTKTESNWRLACETALAPPLFRRFNPMLQTGATQPHAERLPTMVYIVYQTKDLIVPSFSLKTRLSDLRITASIFGHPVPDIGKARKRARQEGVCDWLVFVSPKPNKSTTDGSPGYVRRLLQRGDDARFRLTAIHAGNYLQKQEVLRANELEGLLEQSEKWFNDIDQLRAQLVLFYVELLAAMSPSSGHLFSDTAGLIVPDLGHQGV